jgi:hypothetical protein
MDQSNLRCLLRAGYYWYAGGFLLFNQYHSVGTNIFDQEWELLIVLDSCRVDALREVADEYEFISEVGKITSVGSMTPEWMSHTFTNRYLDYIKQTGYITGNGFIRKVLNQEHNTGIDALPIGPVNYDIVRKNSFGYLEILDSVDFESSSEWTLGRGMAERIHPRYTTERAIRAGRSENLSRLIVHYNYPHEPYPQAEERLSRPFKSLSSGEASVAEVWKEYIQNLRIVLNEVKTLLNNVSASSVIITADHGEAFGEYGFYQHMIACPIPCVRRVPWVETTAEDTGRYDVTAPHPESIQNKKTTEENLKALGYL